MDKRRVAKNTELAYRRSQIADLSVCRVSDGRHFGARDSLLTGLQDFTQSML